MLSEQQQRIMGYFIEEAKDHLNTIEQGLINLQATITDSEMVHEVFRAAHSVKGGAAMLGLSSIQHTAHRLEDYFKILKECPQVQVDQKLETLFLRAYDTLHDLVEQLQGPFGLTDDKAQEAMATVEPVFAELNQHLIQLVEQAGGTTPEDVDLAAMAPAVSQPAVVPVSVPPTSVAEESALQFIFQNDVPARLREMLQLFKQTDTLDSREQLRQVCRSLSQPGEQFDITTWCELLAIAERAIANPDNTYRTLAPIIIKDIKRAQEAVLSGRLAEICACSDLLNLLPVDTVIEEELPVEEDDFADLFAIGAGSDESDELTDSMAAELAASEEADVLFGEALDESATDLFGADLVDADLVDAELDQSGSSIPDWFSSALSDDLGETETALQAGTFIQLEGDNAASDFELAFDFGDMPASEESGSPDSLDLGLLDTFESDPAIDELGGHTGPAVGAEALNSLADLFEGELPDLGLAWQEEEVIDGTPEASSNPLQVPDAAEFSDFFDADESEDLVLDDSDDEDLSGLLNSVAMQANSSQSNPGSNPSSVSEDTAAIDFESSLFDIPSSDSDASEDMAMFFFESTDSESVNAGSFSAESTSTIGFPFAAESFDLESSLNSLSFDSPTETGKEAVPPSFQNLDDLFAGVDINELATDETATVLPEVSQIESENLSNELGDIFAAPEAEAVTNLLDPEDAAEAHPVPSDFDALFGVSPDESDDPSIATFGLTDETIANAEELDAPLDHFDQPESEADSGSTLDELFSGITGAELSLEASTEPDLGDEAALFDLISDDAEPELFAEPPIGMTASPELDHLSDFWEDEISEEPVEEASAETPPPDYSAEALELSAEELSVEELGSAELATEEPFTLEFDDRPSDFDLTNLDLPDETLTLSLTDHSEAQIIEAPEADSEPDTWFSDGSDPFDALDLDGATEADSEFADLFADTDADTDNGTMPTIAVGHSDEPIADDFDTLFSPEAIETAGAEETEEAEPFAAAFFTEDIPAIALEESDFLETSDWDVGSNGFSVDGSDFSDTSDMSMADLMPDATADLMPDAIADNEVESGAIAASEGFESSFANLDALLEQEIFPVAPDPAPITDTALSPEMSPDGDDDFADLESMLTLDAPLATGPSVTQSDDFADLDALLDAESLLPVAAPAPPVAQPPVSVPPSAPPIIVEDEFGDLEALLQDADQKLGVGSSPTRSAAGASARRPTRRNVIVDQTMRVSVKHLDNLNNLVGELVVNRNSLEQAQERLRQFLDNLLYQVQQLNDVGQRMRDLYERSLLESSLLSSRRSYQLSNSGIPMAQTSHATGASFDALEMDRFTGFHTLSQEMIELIVRVRESASDIDFVVEESDQVTRNFRQITTQLQEGLTRSRMVPFAQTADRLPRGIRDNAIKYGKQAELAIEGRDTLIDKMIVEQLYDPMTHLVNNAIAHGIETPEERTAAGKSPTGRITIRAFHQGNQTVISVSDDGAGINPETVKSKAIEKGVITVADAQQMSRLDVYDLLFHHGFSTADKVDDLRGRGVGLDVVRSNLSEIRGVISIDSTVGKGTTFTIRLPLTLSISKALCCISNRARIAFPMDGVEDMLDVPKDRIQMDETGQSCIQWRDTLLPFQSLAELLKYNRVLGRGSVYGGNQEEDMLSIIVLRSAGNYLALQVDQVLGEQEIVIKQLEGPVPKPVGVAGATVLGDGRIMPIADVLELIDLSQGRIRREANNALWETNVDQVAQDLAATTTEPTVLIIDDSITVRELLSMTFNKVGYRVEQARDGQEAWEKLRAGLPCDLVFCDIEMPRMDGLELLSRIQKDPHLSDIPIAMLTSRGADRHRQMAIQLGAKGYFTKPYLEEVLLDAAQRMLKGEVLVAAAPGGQ